MNLYLYFMYQFKSISGVDKHSISCTRRAKHENSHSHLTFPSYFNCMLLGMFTVCFHKSRFLSLRDWCGYSLFMLR